jgi:hypothetical protein
MPVGMVVIVDQNHVQDLLTAFANSRLRIQTTQVHWNHVRVNLKPAVTEEGSDVAQGNQGKSERDPSMVRPGISTGGEGNRALDKGGLASRFQRMSPSTMGAGTGGYSSQMSAMMRAMMGRQGPGMMMGGGVAPSVATEELEEEDPNLMEVSVYGIAALYERFPPKKPATPAEQKDATPRDGKPTDGNTTETKPTDGKPTDGKPTDGKPADGNATETKPTDGKPTDNKPTDGKPADSNPADGKPADGKPGDAAK